MPGLRNGYPPLVQLGVQRVEVAYHHEHGRPRCSIVVMRGQVKPYPVARDLQVHRPVAVAVPPVQQAPEVFDIKANRRRDVVHPQDWNHREDLDVLLVGRRWAGHGASLQSPAVSTSLR